MEESVIKISDMKTLFTASKDHLPRIGDTTAIYASALYVEGKQGSMAPALSDGPSTIGISAIGASAGDPAGEFEGGSSGGGAPGTVAVMVEEPATVAVMVEATEVVTVEAMEVAKSKSDN